MAVRDLTPQRLYVPVPLAAGAVIAASPEQAHYLRSVLRMAAGEELLVFNGTDGEWRVRLAPEGKRGARLHLVAQTRPQESGPDIDYLFAPLKRSRLDYMVQKAVELGVARLSPVITRRTIAERVNLERLQANVVEAAEQCGILRLPIVEPPADLAKVLAGLDTSRALVFCDEAAPVASPLAVLAALPRGTAVAVLIGPEGGFTGEERAMITNRPGTIALSLGPRIMRADTAAVAALALVGAVLGDWA